MQQHILNGSLSKQTMFITDHVHNRSAHNGKPSQWVCYKCSVLWTWSVMNVVCDERGLLWTGLLRTGLFWMRSVMNVVYYERGLLWTGLLWTGLLRTWFVSSGLLWKCLFWTDTILNYQMVSKRWLSQLPLPEELINCEKQICSNQKHIYMREQLYSNVVISLKMTESETIPNATQQAKQTSAGGKAVQICMISMITRSNKITQYERNCTLKNTFGFVLFNRHHNKRKCVITQSVLSNYNL